VAVALTAGFQLYKSFNIAYKGFKGPVRQASAKRTLRKIPKSSLVQVDG